MSKRCQPQPFWTVEEIAEHLSVSIRTVRRWIGQKQLVVHQFGNLVRISSEDFHAFLGSRRK